MGPMFLHCAGQAEGVAGDVYLEYVLPEAGYKSEKAKQILKLKLLVSNILIVHWLKKASFMYSNFNLLSH